jgi:hypothetical protein
LIDIVIAAALLEVFNMLVTAVKKLGLLRLIAVRKSIFLMVARGAVARGIAVEGGSVG